MDAIIIFLLDKAPWLLQVIVILGGLRLVIKPIMTAIDSYVQSTKSLDDDKALEGFKAGKFYTTLVFVLDYVASIKLPKK